MDPPAGVEVEDDKNMDPPLAPDPPTNNPPILMDNANNHTDNPAITNQNDIKMDNENAIGNDEPDALATEQEIIDDEIENNDEISANESETQPVVPSNNMERTLADDTGEIPPVFE